MGSEIGVGDGGFIMVTIMVACIASIFSTIVALREFQYGG
jgi:hypothetical protein